ncbi:hypothetical protein BKA65DRAFT_205254 [Rhexocercosporidium sp. MPI-PUGE-AT-0058]|nr:hypothetical protein BKA65DRAFT_205254 [Rhexocercosporidium sp. MPI-PUGE-AT-0058]
MFRELGGDWHHWDRRASIFSGKWLRVAEVRGEEGSPTITPMGTRRNLFSIRLGMGAFLSITRIVCSRFGASRKKAECSARRRSQVSCIGRSPGVLKEFFSECRAEYLNLLKNKTSVFKHRDGDWEKTRAIDIRPLDAVILDEKKKTALLEDIKAFLDLKHERGILGAASPTGKDTCCMGHLGPESLV